MKKVISDTHSSSVRESEATVSPRNAGCHLLRRSLAGRGSSSSRLTMKRGEEMATAALPQGQKEEEQNKRDKRAPEKKKK